MEKFVSQSFISTCFLANNLIFHLEYENLQRKTLNRVFQINTPEIWISKFKTRLKKLEVRNPKFEIFVFSNNPDLYIHITNYTNATYEYE